MNYSFYGGRQGAAFVIVAHFSTEDEMIAAFRQGPNYTTVNYEEYVIIDTTNKNHKDNGKIYRRGYDYTNTMGGAEYIGQIVGPAGAAPLLESDTYTNIAAMEPNENSGLNYRYKEETLSVDNDSLIPGKYEENGVVKYNDTIKWVSYSVRDQDGVSTTAKIGFKIPYTVIDWVAEPTIPYVGNEENLATRIDGGTHPFYEQWKIQVPRGKKGDSFNNLRVVVANNSVQYPEGFNQQKEDDVSNSRQILVYDVYNYDSSADGVKTTYYAGDYNEISNVNLSPSGKLTINFTHKNSYSYESIKWIDYAYIDANTQKLTIVYNNSQIDSIGEPINYIMATAISDNYHYLVLYSDPVKRAEIVNAGKNATYDYNGESRNDWHDLGSVRSDSGILIGLYYDSNNYIEMSTVEGTIRWLNQYWPNGLVDNTSEILDHTLNLDGSSTITGKLVAVGTGQENKLIYGFNYAKKANSTEYEGWYFIGALNPINVICGKENDNSLIAVIDSLATGGIWFVEED